MRPRLSAVDAMLFATVMLWSLTVIAARYALTHGFAPIAFTALRQVGSTAVLVAVCLRKEGSLSLQRAALPLACVAMMLGCVNQLFFVYAVRTSSASTVGLVLGTVPILAGVIAAAAGIERLSRRVAVAAAVSILGVALVSVGVGGISSGLVGILLALFTALSWAGYTVSIAALAAHASPIRMSAVVMLGYTPLLLAAAAPQLASQDYAAISGSVWACVLGVTLFIGLATPMWFSAIDRVGPAHATLYANLQPFLVVLLGVLLLSERLTRWTIMGGVAIATGLVLAWRARAVAIVD